MRPPFELKPGLIQLCIAITVSCCWRSLPQRGPLMALTTWGLQPHSHLAVDRPLGLSDLWSVRWHDRASPFRYMEIAILMKAGVPQYVAGAIMPAFFTVVAIGLFYSLDWEPEIKVATCLAMISLWLIMFYGGESIRPDNEMNIIWIAALFSLVYVRQLRWRIYAAALAGSAVDVCVSDALFRNPWIIGSGLLPHSILVE